LASIRCSRVTWISTLGSLATTNVKNTGGACNSHEMYRKAWNEAIERVNSASQALVDAGCGPGIVLR